MSFNIKVLPFIIWFYPPLLNNDVSLHDPVKLVVVISTSPRTSKTEFVCECCVRFGVVVFLNSGRPASGTKAGPKAGRLWNLAGQAGLEAGLAQEGKNSLQTVTFPHPLKGVVFYLLKGTLGHVFPLSLSSIIDLGKLAHLSIPPMILAYL